MLISILGDSVSTFEGCSEPYEAAYYDVLHKCQGDILKVEDTWWGQVIDYLGGELLVNNSISGSMVCSHHQCLIESYGCSDKRTSSLHNCDASPDIIMVYLGTNDWGHGVKLQPANNDEAENTDIFSVAYDIMLKKLMKNYPGAEIWCFTLAVSGYKNGKEISFPYTFGGKHIEKYCDIIKDTAASNGCKVIDIYNKAKPFDTIDGFHPNVSGMKSISDAVIKEIEQ